jgi:hypothetical protein
MLFTRRNAVISQVNRGKLREIALFCAKKRLQSAYTIARRAARAAFAFSKLRSAAR